MSVLILGAGICGLGTALMLARDGHDVTVLERDAEALPDSPEHAWSTWTRKGVLQFRQPHNLMPGLRLLLESELPDIQEALRRAGASRYDLVNPLPPWFVDRTPRPLDEMLWTLTARRPVVEWVFANAALREPRLTIRRGIQVTDLLTGAAPVNGTPHVAGVRTAAGEELRADLVIDAMGRQSRGPDWLTAIGAQRVHEEESDCGFVYYTRYFRGTMPERAAPVLTALGTISILTLPGDNSTWSVTVFSAAGDQPLKNLRHEDRWTRVLRACPLHAHWLDGEPITDVLPMSGILDRYRRFVVNDSPAATGFVAVADSWARTNPSAGRGLTVGLMHAVRLRDVTRRWIDKPRGLVEEYHSRTEAEIAPWYRAQIAADRARFAQMEALREGREPAPPVDELAQRLLAFLSAMAADPDLFRTGLEYIGTITPFQDIVRRPGVAERIRAAGAAMRNAPPVSVPGPDRKCLLELVA